MLPVSAVMDTLVTTMECANVNNDIIINRV